tara:strand:- start:3686 stop:4750 length:1065 start_codon:yes stop_codon:yes gene_type:complete
MGLKEKLLENKRLNEENQFKVAQQYSQASYELGYNDSKDIEVDYSKLYDPFIKIYSDIQIKLQNNTSKNPVVDRKYAEDIVKSVEVIKNALENILSNVQVWTPAVQKAGMMGGVDLMGTPHSRYKAMNIFADDLKGIINIVADQGNINMLAYDLYDSEGFVERIYLNKLNKLSESQEMFVSIPDTTKENNDFKLLSTEIFEQQKIGNNPVLTGGVTEPYRKKDSKGEVEIKQESINQNTVQDFYIVDKEAIKRSLQFNTEMNKITAGLLEQQEGYDQAIAFNNNILSTVTDNYLQPAKALTKEQEKKFTEDYKVWFLEKEVGNKFPIGEPRAKEQPQEEVTEQVTEEVTEEVIS